jgi:hypothetical protein
MKKSSLRELATPVPDMPRLLEDFRYAVDQRDSSIFARQRLNYNTRYCLWNYQSEDGRKWIAPKGEDPFPWPGASDSRVRLMELYVNQDVAVGMVAWRRMRTVVSGTELGDAAHANRLTQVLRWMKYTQMKEAADEHEFLLNTLYERGTALMKVCWCREYQLGYDTVDLETLAGFAMQTQAAGEAGVELSTQDENLIELPRLVLDVTREKQAVAGLQVLYPDVRRERLAQLVRDIRTNGTGQLARPYESKNRPVLRALVPNEDVFIAPEASDINQSPIHERELLTETQLRERERSHDWDPEFIEEMLKTQRGRTSLDFAGRNNYSRPAGGGNGFLAQPLKMERLFEIVHSYRRLADEDGVPGIYYTCFSPGLPGQYALHSLLPYDHGEMPFIHAATEKRSRLLDEARGYGEVGSTWQSQIKTEWDSRIDRAAIATLPPSHYPPGEAPDAWGPGVQIPTNRPDDYGFLSAPKYDVGSREVEESVRDFADQYFGRRVDGRDNTDADAQRQHRLNRFLAACGNIDCQTLQLMQQFMPDEFYYRIVGDAKGKPIHASREEIQGKFDVAVSFDLSLLDPVLRKEKLEAMERGIQLDANGRTDRDEAMTLYWEIVDPSMGERLLRAPQDAAQAEIDDEDAVFAKIFAGLNVDIRPGQAYQLRAQRLQNIMQTNPLAQLRYARDGQFKAAVERRMEQLQFQLQQQQNAVTGRFLGTQTKEAIAMEKQGQLPAAAGTMNGQI